MRGWLLEIRRKRNETQQQTADYLGIAQSTYACLESGTRNPSVPVAKKIGNALGFSWTDFFSDGTEADAS